MNEYDAVSTSIEKVETGASRTILKAFSAAPVKLVAPDRLGRRPGLVGHEARRATRRGAVRRGAAGQPSTLDDRARRSSWGRAVADFADRAAPAGSAVAHGERASAGGVSRVGAGGSGCRSWIRELAWPIGVADLRRDRPDVGYELRCLEFGRAPD